MTTTYKHLGAEERGAIMAMKLGGMSARSIGLALTRAPSSITRELLRNGYKGKAESVGMGRPRIAGGYDAVRAGKRARRVRRVRRAARRPRKLCNGSALWCRVRSMLDDFWSPQQIAAILKQEHPGQTALQASHETIYTAIYARPKGELRKELTSLLRQSRGARKAQSRSEKRRGVLQDMLSIHVRPPEVEDRLVPGHWEGDLIKGAGNRSSVGTLVCRKTLFVMIVKVDGATALDVFRGFEAAFGPLDETLRQTLTYDQGKEMALHKKLAESTGLKIYFADPHSPWQRGRNENTNGLIRQYLPKGTDLSVYTQRQLDQIAWSLNTRPRASLGFRTPAAVFFEDCVKQNANIPTGVALDV